MAVASSADVAETAKPRAAPGGVPGAFRKTRRATAVYELLRSCEMLRVISIWSNRAFNAAFYIFKQLRVLRV